MGHREKYIQEVSLDLSQRQPKVNEQEKVNRRQKGHVRSVR